MTVAIPFRVMNVITANTVIEIIVHSAAVTARCVTPQSASDALMNVQAAMSLFVRVVLINVRNVKKLTVKTA